MYPQRRPLRLPHYDYSSPGAYFVTICTQPRKPLFEHPALRKILEETWQSLPERFPAVQLDAFVIMPDHVHFILWLREEVPDRPKLDRVVGAYKSLVARAWSQYTKRKGAGKFWQRSFQERILQSEFELAQRQTYIQNNPLKRELKFKGDL